MKNTFKKIIALSLLTISALGIFATGCKQSAANISTGGNEEQSSADSPITDGEGNDLSDSEIYAMPQSMVFSPVTLASEDAESEVTVTATVTPDDAADKSVVWSVAFKNSSSAWASGKTVTDYVTVTPTSDDGLTAKITNIGAFGEQIILTCASRENPNVKATCTIDYKQQLLGYGIKFIQGENTYDLRSTNDGDDYATISVGYKVTEPVKYEQYYVKTEVYTIELADSDCPKPMEPNSVTIRYSENLSTALRDLRGNGMTPYLTSDTTAKTINFFNRAWIDNSGYLSAQHDRLNAIFTANSLGGVVMDLIVTSPGYSKICTFSLNLSVVY